MRYSDQTIADCGLVNDGTSTSIHRFFNHTRTDGGSIALQDMLCEKKESIEEILQTQASIRYAIAHADILDLGLYNSDIHYLQEYFRADLGVHSPDILYTFFQRFKLSGDPASTFIRSNVLRLASLLKLIHQLISAGLQKVPDQLELIFETFRDCLASDLVQDLIHKNLQDAGGGHFLRMSQRIKAGFELSFNQLLSALFQLEAIVSVARTAMQSNFVFPSVGVAGQLEITGGYHLLIKDPVCNDLHLAESSRLLFLTGANMAGKSTFMRSTGTIVCLAHAGLPVPALEVSMPFYNTIVVHVSSADNLRAGYSKFYNEISVVKSVMNAIAANENVFAVFDEIFSGTNLNDAVECSLILFERLRIQGRCLVMISSHNIQLAGDDNQDHVEYKYIETIINEDQPRFTYRLMPGINEIRLGTILFRKML